MWPGNGYDMLRLWDTSVRRLNGRLKLKKSETMARIGSWLFFPNSAHWTLPPTNLVFFPEKLQAFQGLWALISRLQGKESFVRSYGSESGGQWIAECPLSWVALCFCSRNNNPLSHMAELGVASIKTTIVLPFVQQSLPWFWDMLLHMYILFYEFQISCFFVPWARRCISMQSILINLIIIVSNLSNYNENNVTYHI